LVLSYNKEFKRRFQDSLPGPLFGCVQKSCKRHFRKVRRSVRYGQSLLHKGLPTGPLTITSIIFASPRPPNAQSCLSIFCVRPILLLARLRYSSIALFSFSSPSTHLSTPSRTSSTHKHDRLQVETQSHQSNFVLIHKRPSLAPSTLITLPALAQSRLMHCPTNFRETLIQLSIDPSRAASTRRTPHYNSTLEFSTREEHSNVAYTWQRSSLTAVEKNNLSGGLVHFGGKSMREDDIDHPGIPKRASYSHFHF
jgi:hypothetical protein